MPVSFNSSHTRADWSDGRLTIEITISVSGQPDEHYSVYFTVPRDFHTHNDSVAAAAMTLVGRIHRSAAFNFTISRVCADWLSLYYHLEEVGPVDESLEPRRPGSRLALNFSGGMDSTLLWVLLHEHIGASVVVITTEYEGFRNERFGYQNYDRDVSSRTNLRRLHLDRHGRFNFAVPLLYSDYHDLWGITAGHTYDHAPKSLESLRDGSRPHFLDQDPALLAGGLTEVHLMRGIFELNTAMGLVRAAPQRAEAALRASGGTYTRKYAMKALILRYAFEREGYSVPEYLRTIAMPKVAGRPEGIGWRSLWMVQRFGRDAASEYDERVRDADIRFLDRMSLSFLERYNTNFVTLMPETLRSGLLRAFHQVGYYPYDERDFDELQEIREFLVVQGRQLETPLPRMPE